MDQISLNSDHFLYVAIALFLIEQFLYYANFYFIYKISIKLKKLPIERFVLRESKTQINFLRFTKRNDAVLIRFSPPFGGWVPLPFVGIVEESSNDKLIVKIGPATLILIATLLLPAGSTEEILEVFYGIVFLFMVFLIFVRTTRETIRT